MKRIALFMAVGVIVFFAPGAKAQDHGEVGGFVDYFRLSQTGANFAGVGGRASFNVVPYVQLEAEMSYDFNRIFTEGFTNTGGTITTASSNLSVLHGLFGPKLQTKGPVRIFVTVKGGFANFRFNPAPASVAGFTSTIDNLRTNDVSGALYPGGGVEGFLGPIGLRLDVGDEIVFSGGARHNWKVSFGPTIRF